MKKLSIFMLFVLLATACVDNDYDLRNVDADNITIGDETSTFEAPLARVRITMDDINNNDGTRIDRIFEEADIWLPTRLPDEDANGYYADVQRLLHDAAYVDDEVLPELLAQMTTDAAKLDAVATLLQQKYYDSFVELLPGVSRDEFKSAFVTAYTDDPTMRERLGVEVKALATGYLTGLDVNMENLSYRVDRIDISDEVVDMLADNLDPRETANPTNTLHLRGTIDNRLPVTLSISPLFRPTAVTFTSTIEANCATNELPATRLFADDIRTIVRGIDLDIPMIVERYYPGKGFGLDAQEGNPTQVDISLHLVKHGALKFDL
ncbi:hypothetical protein [Alistipes sp. Marseille-P5061]|uniref:hypothetical protein n=1 Tax=Alistipes sp. Marseille-P5061 TaxID=2048242 RepID=UPI0032094EA0